MNKLFKVIDDLGNVRAKSFASKQDAIAHAKQLLQGSADVCILVLDMRTRTKVFSSSNLPPVTDADYNKAIRAYAAARAGR